jgi:hypothetical protein
VVLRPHVIARFGFALAGLAPVIGVLAVLSSVEHRGLALAALTAVVAVASAVIAVRGFRMAVVIDSQSVVVQGWLWSRTIRRRAVYDVTEFPALRWTDGSSHRRWTPILMFMTSSRGLGEINRYNERAKAMIRKRLQVG